MSMTIFTGKKKKRTKEVPINLFNSLPTKLTSGWQVKRDTLHTSPDFFKAFIHHREKNQPSCIMCRQMRCNCRRLIWQHLNPLIKSALMINKKIVLIVFEQLIELMVIVQKGCLKSGVVQMLTILTSIVQKREKGTVNDVMTICF